MQKYACIQFLFRSSGGMYQTRILEFFDLKRKHHPTRKMFRYVAMGHPFSRILHVDQNLDRGALWDQSRVFPDEIRIFHTIGI